MKYDFQSQDAAMFPPMVIVDVTNVCNMRCTHCPHSAIAKGDGYKATFMKDSLFRKIVDEMAEHRADLLRIASDGESLLHPDVIPMLRYAKGRLECPVNLTTNGMLLEENVAGDLLDMGLDLIDVSIDAFSAETYEKVRLGGDYERVVKNTKRLIALRDGRKDSKTKIMVSIIDQPAVSHEVGAFNDYWSGKADLVLIRKYNDCHGMVGAPGKAKVERWPCPQLWKRITINCDGRVKYCVEDWLSKTAIGDLNSESIREIWQGQTYRKLRSLHTEGEYKGVTLCDECTDWQNSPWDYGYDHALKKLSLNG